MSLLVAVLMASRKLKFNRLNGPFYVSVMAEYLATQYFHRVEHCSTVCLNVPETYSAIRMVVQFLL